MGSCGSYTVYRSPQGTLFAPGWSGSVAVGNNQGNTFLGSSGPDLYLGLGGNDAILSFAGDDVLCGGDGVDLILGYEGNDFIDGGNGSDVFNGGNGDFDQIFGGEGSDVFLDADGVQTVTGGIGNDVFVVLLRHGWRNPQGQTQFNGLSAGYGNDVVSMVIFDLNTTYFVDITGDERDVPPSPQEGNSDILALVGAIDRNSPIIKFEIQSVSTLRNEMVIPTQETGREYLTEPVGDGAEELMKQNSIYLPLINR